MAAIGIIAGIAGTAVNVMGAMYQAEAQKAQAEYQAAVSRMYARQERETGYANEVRNRMEVGQRMSALRASQGASGLLVSSPSLTRVRQSAAELGELDVKTERHKSELAAWAHEAEAAQADFAAESAEQAGFLNAIGAGVSGITSIMSDASPVSSTWAPFRRARPQYNPFGR